MVDVTYNVTFNVMWSQWDRFVMWLHGKRYHVTEIMPAGEGALLIECSCGGHAQVRRRDDGFADIEVATCGLWRRIRVRSCIVLPEMRVV